ncbi:hypothetical protein KAT63_04050 [Candidatus Parcubacteria bacterium]|nr:hypothetical protein [Candidatus Parcubacteria bacterium]
MPTKEEITQKINDVSAILSQILEYDIDKDLVRTEGLGTQLNFVDCKTVFEKIFNISNELKEGSIKDLPFSKISSIESHSRVVLNKLNEINKFDPMTQSSTRESLINQVNDSYESYYANIFDILNFIKLQKLKPLEMADKVKHNLSVIKEASGEADKKLDEINEVLNKTKQVAGETGVAEYSKYFGDEANEHKKEADKWFKAVIVMSALTIVWGIALFQIETGLSTGDAIQLSIAKFIVLSVLFYGLVLTTKNYNAHKHNHIVNKHRSNSLNSFESFVKSTKDPATQDAVLLQATQSIFSPQPTGYDHNDGDVDSSNKFIEILRHIEPKGK